MSVGLRIKELRGIEGVSQEEFAHRIDLDRSYLASIEVGKRNVALVNLGKIASGFGMTLSEFFEGVSEAAESEPHDADGAHCKEYDKRMSEERDVYDSACTCCAYRH